MNEDEARKRAHQLRNFYISLTSFIVINLFLFAVNMLTDRDNLWFYWVTIFWGFGLVWQAIAVFGGGASPWGKDWEERKTQELMQKDKS